MCIRQIFQLVVLVVLCMGKIVFAADQAASPAALIQEAVKHALDDKRLDEGEEDEGAEGDDVEDGEDEVVKPITALIPSDLAAHAVAQPSYLRTKLNAFKQAAVNKAYDLRGIDYRAAAQKAWDYVQQLRQHGVVQGCWNRARAARWYSRVILPEHRTYNVVHIFPLQDGEETKVYTTTDGYDFILPHRVLGEGFLTAEMSEKFRLTLSELKKVGVNVSSRILYLVCMIRSMQLAGGAVQDCYVFFKEHAAELMQIVRVYSNKELFDAIKICRYFNITDSVIIGTLYYTVAKALVMRGSLDDLDTLVDRAFPLLTDEAHKQAFYRAVYQIIMGSKVVQYALAAGAGDSAVRPALEGIVLVPVANTDPSVAAGEKPYRPRRTAASKNVKGAHSKRRPLPVQS